jgi:serralysin
MASIPGGQFAFFAANKPVNVVLTPDGHASPPPVPGDFNLELVTSPQGTAYGLPAGYQGVALLANQGHTLNLLQGDIGVSVIGNGPDTIIAGSGNDTIYGGHGPELIVGGSGRDLIFGGGGADTIYGGIGSETIYGGAGRDEIHGGAGPQLIDGGDGADTIYGGTGPETIYGGNGDDLI